MRANTAIHRVSPCPRPGIRHVHSSNATEARDAPPLSLYPQSQPQPRAEQQKHPWQEGWLVGIQRSPPSVCLCAVCCDRQPHRDPTKEPCVPRTHAQAHAQAHARTRTHTPPPGFHNAHVLVTALPVIKAKAPTCQIRARAGEGFSGVKSVGRGEYQ